MAFKGIGIANLEWGSKIDLFDPECSGAIAWEIHQRATVGSNKHDENAPVVLGDNPPAEICGPMMYQSDTFYAVRFEQAFLNPEWGIVFTDRSVFFEPSAWAARYKSPDLSQVDGYDETEAIDHFTIDDSSDLYHRGTFLVLNHWGGKNFGHFIYDSLPAVFIFLSEIVSGRLKLITSPLANWQWSFLVRMGVPRSSVVETEARLCKFERLIFPSSLSGNIYLPSFYTKSMFDYIKISGNGQDRANSPKRIFVSRKNIGQRMMLNESDLDAALSDRGFTKVYPETMDVDQQISLFSNAEIVVGELGAALSNVSFADRGCAVVEIMPELKLSPWIKNLCTLLEFQWKCVYVHIPEEYRQNIEVDGVVYSDLNFSYNLDINSVTNLVDSMIS